MTTHPRAVVLSARSGVMLVFAGVVGLLAFCWPLIIDPTAVLARDASGTLTAPVILGIIMALTLGLLVTQLTGDDLDVKAIAMLGVLTAVGAVVRPLGAGSAGMETVFFLLILGGRGFGAGFGFMQGTLSLFASALVTGGLGPWLPYQMLGAGFVGLGAGLLPGRGSAGSAGRGRELAILGAYGFVSSFAYGYLTDLAFWPFFFGAGMTQVGFDPAAGFWANLQIFFVVNTATSLAWNLGRSITSVVLLVLLGPSLLRIFGRASRRARFAA